MIKNERQYRITKSQAEKFAKALARLQQGEQTDRDMARLEANAIRSQLSELQQLIEEYDALRSGQQMVITVDSFDELPEALIKARIGRGISQKALAERLGLKEQQIQRYESTNYASASIARIKEIVDALDITVRKEVFLPASMPTMQALLKRVFAAGVDRDLLLGRILPPDLAHRVSDKSASYAETDVCQVASLVSRVYGSKPDELLANDTFRFSTEAAGIARFKIPAGADQRKASTYTIYAHYLALLVLHATPHLRPIPISDEPDAFRQEIIERYGDLTLTSILAFAWDHGIPVLPLSDPGAFHGAFWRVAGRNVVVLKQSTSSVARWLNDCLHELYHAAQEPEQQERSIIEASETSLERRNSDEEQEATAFASDVILDGRAEELAEMCVQAAGGMIPRLKSVVPMVAANEGVDVGALANYIAFRLSLQDVNWWATATNLQPHDDTPQRLVRDWLIARLDISRLCEPDRSLLLRAISH